MNVVMLKIFVLRDEIWLRWIIIVGSKDCDYRGLGQQIFRYLRQSFWAGDHVRIEKQKYVSGCRLCPEISGATRPNLRVRPKHLCTIVTGCLPCKIIRMIINNDDLVGGIG